MEVKGGWIGWGGLFEGCQVVRLGLWGRLVSWCGWLVIGEKRLQRAWLESVRVGWFGGFGVVCCVINQRPNQTR